MNVKELILDTLAPDQEETDVELNLLSIYKRDTPIGRDDFIPVAKKVIRELQQDATENAAYLVACLSFSSYLMYDDDGTKMAVLSLEYEKTKDPALKDEIIALIEKIVVEIEKEAKMEEINNRFMSRFSVFDYLGDYFGDDLESEIMAISGVSKPTAKKYLRGGDPAWKNWNIFKNLARIFYRLEREKQMTKEEILDWYENTSIEKRGSVRKILIRGNSFSYYLEDAIKRQEGLD